MCVDEEQQTAVVMVKVGLGVCGVLVAARGLPNLTLPLQIPGSCFY